MVNQSGEDNTPVSKSPPISPSFIRVHLCNPWLKTLKNLQPLPGVEPYLSKQKPRLVDGEKPATVKT
jgi:hypothetical protein